MKRTDTAHNEGAELTFDVQGSGQPLLLIPGAGGDAGVYGPLAPALADAYTVITYDRRCNARSTGNRDVPLDMAQQARDALAVLRAAGHGKALVFGNSGGANIALQLAADHPGTIAFLVLHEPPVISLLGDDGDTLAFVDRVYQTSQAEGAPAAMKLFASRLTGLAPPPQQAGAAPRPGGLGQAKDMAFFFSKEYLNLTLFKPDLGAIKAAGMPAAVLAGERSGDAYYVRSARKVAEALGCPLQTVPGNHLAFLFEPGPFAAAIRGVLAAASGQ